MPKPHKIKKLSKEQKKAIWSSPKSNAGAGWWTKQDYRQPTDPLDFLKEEDLVTSFRDAS